MVKKENQYLLIDYDSQSTQLFNTKEEMVETVKNMIDADGGNLGRIDELAFYGIEQEELKSMEIRLTYQVKTIE